MTASAGAHAALVTADPVPDSVTTALPEQMTVVFSDAVSRTGTAVTVTAPEGTQASGEISVDGNRVFVPLWWGGWGVYAVQWQNVSLDDGHEASGTFQFTLSEG